MDELDTSQVVYMTYMFEGCSSLTEVDLKNFDTSNVESLYGMFWECSSLNRVDLSGFDVSNVYNMDKMFYSCSSLIELITPQNLTDLSIVLPEVYRYHWVNEEGSICTEAYQSGMKYTRVWYMPSGTDLDLTWSISEDGVLTIEGTGDYNGADWCSYEYKDIITSAVVKVDGISDTSEMFKGLYNLVSIDLSELDTSNVISMYEMFYGCSNLTELDLSSFDTSNVKSMSWMFADCSSLEKLNLSNFDTSNVKNMSFMFAFCDNHDRKRNG